jgi:hypothetical protein
MRGREAFFLGALSPWCRLYRLVSRRTNRNAATWQEDHDIALLHEVAILRSEGLSERLAIKRIAADRKKRHLFPYREQKNFVLKDVFDA